MDYININLSEKKYEKTKKNVVINMGIFILANLFLFISLINIILIFNISSQNEKKSRTLNGKIKILTEKIKEQEKSKIKYEENNKKNNISEERKQEMEKYFTMADTVGATEVLNIIEEKLPSGVIVTKFSMYEKKINITVTYEIESKVMEFVNNLQKNFSDVFILENKNNAVNIEINI